MSSIEALRNMDAKRDLDSQQLSILHSELKNRGKDKTIAYLLWFFLGYFGGHRFYMGKTGSAVGMLVTYILSWMTVFIVIGFIGFVAMFIWWIIDAINLGKWIDAHNQKVESEIIYELQRGV